MALSKAPGAGKFAQRLILTGSLITTPNLAKAGDPTELSSFVADGVARILNAQNPTLKDICRQSSEKHAEGELTEMLTEDAKEQKKETREGVKSGMDAWKVHPGTTQEELKNPHAACDRICESDCSQPGDVGVPVPTDVVPAHVRTGDFNAEAGMKNARDIDFCKAVCDEDYPDEPPTKVIPSGDGDGDTTGDGDGDGDGDTTGDGDGDGDLTCKDIPGEGECDTRNRTDNPDGTIGMEVYINPEECWQPFVCGPVDDQPGEGLEGLGGLDEPPFVVNGKEYCEGTLDPIDGSCQEKACDDSTQCCEEAKEDINAVRGELSTERQQTDADLEEIRGRADDMQREINDVMRRLLTRDSEVTTWGDWLKFPATAPLGLLLLVSGVAGGGLAGYRRGYRKGQQNQQTGGKKSTN